VLTRDADKDTLPINRKETEPFRHLELLARKVVEGFITGLHKSPFHGFSVEFAEHRLYNKGESTRHIDWKLFARSDKLFVKRYEEETNLRCQIVLDISSSMRFPEGVEDNKLRFSVYAAAALFELLKGQRDAVGLTLFAETVRKHFPPKGNPTHQKLLFNNLEALLESKEEGKSTAAAEALDQVAEIVHQRSMIVIFSDMFEAKAEDEKLFSALQHLKYKKHEVVLFHVVDKTKELDFDFENRPYRFIDLESGEEIKLNPVQVRDLYKRSVADFQEKLKSKCNQFKIDYVAADINAGFDKVLQTYLVKRQNML
jgi:uncharacterized protein (DUF58 family)